MMFFQCLKNKSKKIMTGLLAGSFLLSVGVVQASEEERRHFWHTSKISKIYPHSNGSFVLVFETQSEQCTNGANYYYVANGANRVNAEGVKNMLAVALTAAATNKTIAVNFDSHSSSCHINRLSINF